MGRGGAHCAPPRPRGPFHPLRNRRRPDPRAGAPQSAGPVSAAGGAVRRRRLCAPGLRWRLSRNQAEARRCPAPGPPGPGLLHATSPGAAEVAGRCPPWRQKRRLRREVRLQAVGGGSRWGARRGVVPSLGSGQRSASTATPGLPTLQQGKAGARPLRPNISSDGLWDHGRPLGHWCCWAPGVPSRGVGLREWSPGTPPALSSLQRVSKVGFDPPAHRHPAMVSDLLAPTAWAPTGASACSELQILFSFE